MKLIGKVISGQYAGQSFDLKGPSRFPRWVWVGLTDKTGHYALREVRVEVLERES